MPGPLGRLRLIIESRLENVALLGGAIRSLAHAAAQDETTAFQLELCLVEAATNAIRHAYGGQPGKEVEVTVELTTERISFLVCDSGQPHPSFALLTAPFDWQNRAQIPEGGMGLAIIREIMDEVQYSSDSGRNCLAMTKFRAASSAPRR